MMKAINTPTWNNIQNIAHTVFYVVYQHPILETQKYRQLTMRSDARI